MATKNEKPSKAVLKRTAIKKDIQELRQNKVNKPRPSFTPPEAYPAVKAKK